ncbi:MAG: rRNA maturation RNase YbeY [Planctomycetes bacterium]|nr:rRNA maturation RNase YbeY [Planctomycetota bacterium]
MAISNQQRTVRVPRRTIGRLVRFVAERESIRLAEADIAVVDGGEIRRLNRRHLGREWTTDVLSFDMTEKPGAGLSVQIVVCGPDAARQGPHHGNTPARELMIYIIHGLLHQMGHEDATIRGAARMHAREDELLREFFRPGRVRRTAPSSRLRSARRARPAG